MAEEQNLPKGNLEKADIPSYYNSDGSLVVAPGSTGILLLTGAITSSQSTWQDTSLNGQKFVFFTIFSNLADTVKIDYSEDASSVLFSSATFVTTAGATYISSGFNIPTRYWRVNETHAGTTAATYRCYATTSTSPSINNLGAGNQVVGAVTQSGTWNVGTITTLPALATGTNTVGTVTIEPVKATYAGGQGNYAGVIGEWVSIYGSASKTVRVRKIRVSALATAASVLEFSIQKKSTVASGGTTTTALNAAPMDSTNAAQTATTTVYSVTPTSGTTVGTILDEKLFLGASPGPPGVVEVNWYRDTAQAPVLRGVAQGLVVNLAGSLPAGSSLNIYMEWTEE